LLLGLVFNTPVQCLLFLYDFDASLIYGSGITI
jgi:hypothetical protein